MFSFDNNVIIKLYLIWRCVLWTKETQLCAEEPICLVMGGLNCSDCKPTEKRAVIVPSQNQLFNQMASESEMILLS